MSSSPQKFAGIGGRDTPISVCNRMIELGMQYAERGWILRSGGARGADSAFELGYKDHPHLKEIFLPYQLYEGNKSPLYERPPQEAYDMIDLMWSDVKYRTDHVRTMFARNCQQILGANLDDPSDLVICWTRGGKVVGGTGKSIQIAKMFGIPVINLYNEEFDLYGF